MRDLSQSLQHPRHRGSVWENLHSERLQSHSVWVKKSSSEQVPVWLPMACVVIGNKGFSNRKRRFPGKILCGHSVERRTSPPTPSPVTTPTAVKSDDKSVSSRWGRDSSFHLSLYSIVFLHKRKGERRMNRGSSAGQLSNKRGQVAVWRQRLEGDGVGREALLFADGPMRILPGDHLFRL